MPPVDNDTGTEQPADDIRSALAAALAEHDEPAAAPEKVAKAPGAADAATGDEAGADAPAPARRSPDGKFKKAGDTVAAEAEPEAAEAKTEGEGEAAPEKTDEEKAEAAKEASAKAETELTGKWSAKDKEAFKALPPEGKELILRRHKEMEGAFTKKTQEIAAFRKEYEPVSRLLEPWNDRMKQSGYTPQSLITAWANVEKRLMEGDGVGVVAGLIKGYKIDLGKVASALGIKPLAQAAQRSDTAQPEAISQDGAQPIQLPPEITDQLRSLQERIDAQDRERADAARRARMGAEQNVMSEIEKFKGAQDDKGNLLHPHFDELEEKMTSLAQAAIAARKPVPSLKELYEDAVWANPSTREAKLAADRKAQQDKAATEARAKAAAAKKAASSVTGAPGSGQAPAARGKAEQTLREQLLEAAAENESAL